MNDQISSVTEPFPGQESGRLNVEDLLATANAYAAQAVQSLIAQADEDPQRLRGLFYNYVELAYRLEIHFLFPNLGDYERGLLVSLANARSAIMVGLRNSGQPRSSEQQQDHQRALLELKTKYVHTRAEVMSRDVRSHLTPVQQQILDKELLTIPFEGATTFVRRPEA
jgi:hypothetical protein